MMGNNISSKQELVALYKSTFINKIRFYEVKKLADPSKATLIISIVTPYSKLTQVQDYNELKSTTKLLSLR